MRVRITCFDVMPEGGLFRPIESGVFPLPEKLQDIHALLLLFEVFDPFILCAQKWLQRINVFQVFRSPFFPSVLSKKKGWKRETKYIL